MRTHTSLQVEAGLAGLLTAATATAGSAIAPAPERQVPEVRLYFTVPVGAHPSGVALGKFGIGFGRVQATGNLGNPAAGDPIRRRELLTFDVSPRQGAPAPELRFTLGGRMTYDLNRGVFGWRKGRWAPEPTGMDFSVPARPASGEAVRESDGCCRPTQPRVLLRESKPALWQLPGEISVRAVHGPPNDHLAGPAPPAR